MRKIGLILDSFGPSDIAFDAIYNIERAPREIDITGFYLIPNRPCLAPRFSIMESFLGYTYAGPIVATSLSTAQRVLKAASATDRYFYMWNLDWLHQPVPFSTLYELLNGLKLIARTQEIADHLEKVWGVKVEVAKNFGEIWQLIEEPNGQ